MSVGPKGQQANGGSYDSVVSANGRFVALVSVATILVPHGTNGNIHVFIRDRGTDKTEPMSVEKPRLRVGSAAGGRLSPARRRHRPARPGQPAR